MTTVPIIPTVTSAYQKLVGMLNSAARNGKVLDVSTIGKDATGIKITNIPKTARGTKKGVEGFPVISNNYESYRYAMEILGPEYAVYAEMY
jgi:hypothetical protein